MRTARREAPDYDLSFQSFNDIVYPSDTSLSSSNSHFPPFTLSISLNYQQSSLPVHLHYRPEPGQPIHDLSFRQDNLSEHSECQQYESSFEQSEIDIEEEDWQYSNSSSQFHWVEEHEVPDPSWISPELTEGAFDSSDHSSMSEEEGSRLDSPFFPEPESQRGMSMQEIRALPTMEWRVMHQRFNGGEKCSVCLQEYRVGDSLRVMVCLHRFHIDCLDEWLMNRPNCPNCRMSVC